MEPPPRDVEDMGFRPRQKGPFPRDRAVALPVFFQDLRGVGLGVDGEGNELDPGLVPDLLLEVGHPAAHHRADSGAGEVNDGYLVVEEVLVDGGPRLGRQAERRHASELGQFGPVAGREEEGDRHHESAGEDGSDVPADPGRGRFFHVRRVFADQEERSNIRMENTEKITFHSTTGCRASPFPSMTRPRGPGKGPPKGARAGSGEDSSPRETPAWNPSSRR